MGLKFAKFTKLFAARQRSAVRPVHWPALFAFWPPARVHAASSVVVGDSAETDYEKGYAYSYRGCPKHQMEVSAI